MERIQNNYGNRSLQINGEAPLIVIISFDLSHKTQKRASNRADPFQFTVLKQTFLVAVAGLEPATFGL